MRAGVLYLALFLSFMISSLIGALLLIGKFQNQLTHEYLICHKLRDNLESAKVSGLLDSNIKSGQKFCLFSEEESDSAKISFKQWGTYQLMKVDCYLYGRIANKEFLLGAKPTLVKSFSLINLGTDKILNLAGTAKLKGGTNYLKTKIKEVYFEGKAPSVTMDLNFVSKEMFSVDEKFINSINEIKNEISAVIRIDEYKDRKSVEHSFKDSTLILWSENDLNLSEWTISGNIILKSNGKITIANDCKLKHLLICANEIIVKSGFKGNCQLIAEKSIKIEDNCYLGYPSSVSLVSTQTDNHIFIGKNSNIEGTVLYLKKGASNDGEKTQCNIQNEGEIYGLIFCDGAVEQRGGIYGCLCCKELCYNTNNGNYSNYLIDNVIDNTSLNPYYSEPLIFKEQSDKEVIYEL